MIRQQIAQNFYRPSFKSPCLSFQKALQDVNVSIWKFFKRYIKSGFFKKNVDDLEKCTCASLAIFEKRDRDFWKRDDRNFELICTYRSSDILPMSSTLNFFWTSLKSHSLVKNWVRSLFHSFLKKKSALFFSTPSKGVRSFYHSFLSRNFRDNPRNFLNFFKKYKYILRYLELGFLEC